MSLHITSEPYFASERLVIITSSSEIEAPQWRQYLVTNWGRLTRRNSRILVLAGIHGERDGKIGPVDGGLLDDNKRQLRVLRKKLNREMEENNIEIILEDVGTHMYTCNHMDENKLVAAIKNYNPTLIILAFCYTAVSELNDILRSAGIYTFLIMQEDHAKITEGRYAKLDPIQKEIVEEIAGNTFLNLFVWGSYGTGKTLLLTQALEMKMSFFRRAGRPVMVIVAKYDTIGDDQMKVFEQGILKLVLSLSF